MAHQRNPAQGQVARTCETLFGISDIPSDNDISLIVDGAAPAAFDGVCLKALERVADADAMAPFQRRADAC